MSKINDMAMTIEELLSAAAISDIADWLAQQFSGETVQSEAAPDPEPSLTWRMSAQSLRICPGKVTQRRLAPCFRNTTHLSSPALIRQTTEALLKDMKRLNHA